MAESNWVRFHRNTKDELAPVGSAWFFCATCRTESLALVGERPASCACTEAASASIDELTDFSNLGLQRRGGR